MVEKVEGVHGDEEMISELNPALSDEVLEGEKWLPAGYIVRVPWQLGRAFALEAINQDQMLAQNRLHVVRDGDSLESISALYQIPVQQLQEINHFLPGEPLTTGMVLNIPRETGVALKPAGEDPPLTP